MENLKSKKNVLIVDGYSFIFRAFFSLKDLKTKSGTPIGAVYGFINMILKLLNTFEIEYIAIVFDSGKKTFRNEIYPEYKANRPECPPDLKPQFEIIRKACESLNIKHFEMEGFEADDVIASLVMDFKEKGFNLIVVSSDKDLMQLAKDGEVEFFDPIKNKILREKEVEEKFGVKPIQISDYLAIVGDSSDNIPGVAGIGEKGAAELLSSFKTLEEIYENIESVAKPKLKNALEKSKEKAFLSKQLATLKTDVAVPEIEVFKKKNFEKEKLFLFLKEYDLHSIITKLIPEYNQNQADLFEETQNEKPEIKIENVKDLEVFFQEIKHEPEVQISLQESKLSIKTESKNISVSFKF